SVRPSTGLRRCALHPVHQPGFDEYPFMGTVDQSMCRVSWFLNHHTAGEVGGKLIEFVMHHGLGMAPSFLRPEQVHTDPLHQDTQQQGAAEYAEEAKRQGDHRTDDVALPSLLPLCGGCRVIHGASALSVSVVVICL